MPSNVHPTPVPRLVLAQLRARAWSRALLWGAAGILLATALLSALLLQLTDLWSFGLVTCVLAPLMVSGLVAADFAALREPRFAEAVFTAPVPTPRLLLSKLAANLAVGLLYVAALLPLAGLALLHVGAQPVLVGFLGVALGVVLVAVATGAFAGVLLGHQGALPAVALAVGLGVVHALAVFLGIAGLASGAPALARVAHVSPALHLMGAAGVLPGHAPAAPLRSVAAVAALVGGLLLVTAWAFLRQQGPLAWRSRPSSRGLLALASVLVLLLPVLVAGTEYEPRTVPGQGAVRAYDNRGMYVAIVPPGAPVADARFDDHVSSDDAPLPVSRATRRDVLVLLPVAPGVAVTGLRLAFASVHGDLIVEEAGRWSLDAPVTTERRIPGDDGLGQVVRLPATLTPVSPSALVGNGYVVEVEASYDAGGARHEGAALRTVTASVPGAWWQVLVAGAPAVAVAGAAAARRQASVAGGRDA